MLPELAEIAGAVLGAADIEGTAEQVVRAIGRLGIEDVWDRPGQFSERSDGDDSDGAYRLVEEKLEPFVRDLERRVRLGRDAEALALCQGVLLGLYRVHRDHGDDFLGGAAPDAPSNMAAWVVETWRRAGGRSNPRRAPDRALLRRFAVDSLPDWEPWLTRVIGRELVRHRRA